MLQSRLPSIAFKIAMIALIVVFFSVPPLPLRAQQVAAVKSGPVGEVTPVTPPPLIDDVMGLGGTIAERPIMVGYSRGTSPTRVMDYMQNLVKRLDIAHSMLQQLQSEQQQERMEKVIPKVPDPLYGIATYMVTGLIPSFESVSFQQVVDEADAHRLISGRKDQWGPTGTLEDHGNGCFTVGYRNVSSYPLPPGSDVKDYDRNNQPSQRGYQFRQKVVEKDGVKMVEQSQVFVQMFRYHEQMLYEANFEELFTMQLPTADAMISDVDRTKDLGFNAYLDRIPMGIRQLGWSMLSAAAGSQLQQRDDEPESTYTMRKSGGDLALALISSILFDIDNSSGWARFSSNEDGSLRGELKVRARNNSMLGKRLLDASGNSRFAPILNDHAAATLHLCTRLPDEGPLALQATGSWLTETMGREFSGDPAMVSAGQALAGILTGISDHRNLEFLIKVGWTPTSSGVIYGGIQLNEDPELLKSVHHLLTHLPGAPAGIDQLITLEDRQGMQVIVLRSPESLSGEPAIRELRELLGANITHLYLAHQNSCLWFSAGTENAVEIIRQSAERCSENSRAARTPLISARIDAERWASYPQDDPAGISSMLYWLDENAGWFPPTPFGFAFGGQRPKPNPLLQRVFDLGGSQHADFSIEADESGLLLQASLGEALGNYMIARMLDSQESMMEQQRKQMQEMEARAKVDLQKAAEKLPAPPAP